MQNCDLDVLGAEAAGKVRPSAVAEEGVTGADGRKLRRKFTEEVWALAGPEYMAGASALEISKKYGMSVQTVYLRFAGRGKRAREREAKLAKAKPEPRPLTQEETTGVARIVLAEACEAAAAKLRGTPAKVETHAAPDGKRKTRVSHPPETWAKVRRDYEVGGFTVPAIAERYGIRQATIKRRARLGKWSKTVRKDVPPLKPPDDPAQVETGEDGEARSAWLSVAHPAQLPPEGNWMTWLFQGGRGAGKTRAGAEWLAGLAEETPHGRFALVGATEADVRSVMIEGPSGLLNLPGRKPIHYEPSLKRVTWKESRAMAFVFSAEEPERLRGPQFDGAWADEFCAWPRPEYMLQMLRLGLRLGKNPRLAITTTPKPIREFRALLAERSCAVTQAPTAANAANLSAGFVAGLEALYGGRPLARQELMGELVDGEGALWRAGQFERARGERPDKLERVVVAVDPPAGAQGVCGIVAAGLADGRGYVLEDASIVGASPTGWARRVKETQERWGARKILVETNQGGDMVRSILALEDVRCRVEPVYAVEGKRARAEPVAARYEKELVTHCGVFALLEEEMMALGCARSEKSGGRFDRADALVWALTDLVVKKPPPQPGIISL